MAKKSRPQHGIETRANGADGKRRGFEACLVACWHTLRFGRSKRAAGSERAARGPRRRRHAPGGGRASPGWAWWPRRRDRNLAVVGEQVASLKAGHVQIGPDIEPARAFF